LCEVIIELGQRFGLTTVAEGIESVHEYHKLQGLGCDIGQGYLFAKPLPKREFIGLASRRLAPGPARPDGSGPCRCGKFSPDPGAYVNCVARRRHLTRAAGRLRRACHARYPPPRLGNPRAPRNT
jgi:hypothetical protein